MSHKNPRCVQIPTSPGTQKRPNQTDIQDDKIDVPNQNPLPSVKQINILSACSPTMKVSGIAMNLKHQHLYLLPLLNSFL